MSDVSRGIVDKFADRVGDGDLTGHAGRIGTREKTPEQKLSFAFAVPRFPLS